MPATPTYPGVYVEEVSFRATIRGLPTTQAAFVGTFPAGPSCEPQQIVAISEFDDLFGAGASDTIAGRALNLFLDNGGHSPIVVRMVDGNVAAALAGVNQPCNLLVIPETATMPEPEGTAAVLAAQEWAGRNGVFYVVDPPGCDTAQAVQQWVGSHPAIRSSYSAAYWPQLEQSSGAAVPPGGAVAGVYVRTDNQRGVWKAPAGIEAVLSGVSGLSVPVSEADERSLTSAGINPLRHTGQRPMVWGARTISSDPEWKYVPVRRLAMFIERSVEQGTRWAVFEPNGAALWDSVRGAAESFLHALWRDGAFQGASPDDAYFVRCDRSTMTQNDIDNGRLIIQIGVAPLRPAEFVILTIKQKTQTSSGVALPALSRLLRATANLGVDDPLKVLFAGPSGTGKTVLAQALAGQLGRALIRVDLHAALSKYIGETEKNLAAVFNQAARSHAILFFDEADALFGRRTKADSATDRYANLEVSYLLRRIETHQGIVILATNRIGKLDRTFQIVKVSAHPE